MTAQPEEVELEPERRRYVDETYAGLERLTHYELLGVPRDADRKAIKRAYFGLAAAVHPDRYFGKQLGSYKPKMEVLFARITGAFEALSGRDERPAYDATLAPARAAGSERARAADAPRAPVDPKILAKRQEAMEALKARFADGKAKVRQHVDAAKRARAAGDLAAAVEAYRRALLFAPDDDDIGAAYAELQRDVAARLVASIVKKAQLEERFGQWEQAAASWKRVTLARPGDEAARERLAGAMARAGRG